MQPTSSVGYSLVNTLNDDDGNAEEITQYVGAGDVNRIYGGVGLKLFKGFSVGLELDFFIRKHTKQCVKMFVRMLL